MTISTRYIYSACITSTTSDVTILQDPWFTPGAYDGSWFQWPVINDPLLTCGNSDYVYISHIHPDHYDPKFLRQYFCKYGNKCLLIAKRSNNHLYKKAVSDGFDVIEVDTTLGLKIRNTHLYIVPHNSKGSNNIDSSLIIRNHDAHGKTHTVVNLNDCIYDLNFYKQVRDISGSEIDILFLTYTGAGPFPQCFFSESDPELQIQASKKEELFLHRYLQTINFFEPRVAVPFAGQYVLGGRLASLNSFSGNCDSYKVLSVSNNSIVLQEGGDNIISSDGTSCGQRKMPHDQKAMQAYASSIPIIEPNEKIGSLSFEYIEPVLLRLLTKAAKNARKAQRTDLNWFYIFAISANYSYAVHVRDEQCLALDSSRLALFKSTCSYIQVQLEYNHFFFLLTGVLHWNNAIVGSWLQYERRPDIYIQELQTFLNHLTV